MATSKPLPTPVERPTIGDWPWWQRLQMRWSVFQHYGRGASEKAWTEAVHQGNRTLAQSLLGAGLVVKPEKDPAHRYDVLSNLLLEAVTRLDQGQMTQALLTMGANPNHIHPNDYWDAPTHRAARARNVPAFLALLAAHPNLDLADGNGYTPMLTWVTEFGEMHTQEGKLAATVDERWAMVEACLAAGANPNLRSRVKESLLSAALTDTPERVAWALEQGCTSFDPRADLEDVFFCSLRRLNSPNPPYPAIGSGLARHRKHEDDTFQWDRAGILAILERQGWSYEGINAAGRTFFEEGLERGELEAADVPYLVARGVPLDHIDARGNSLTHQLLTRRSYSNGRGRDLFDALMAAGLPKQWDLVNADGDTPEMARARVIGRWSVQEAQALDLHLPSPLILPSARFKQAQAPRVRLGKA